MFKNYYMKKVYNYIVNNYKQLDKNKFIIGGNMGNTTYSGDERLDELTDLILQDLACVFHTPQFLPVSNWVQNYDNQAKPLYETFLQLSPRHFYS